MITLEKLPPETGSFGHRSFLPDGQLSEGAMTAVRTEMLSSILPSCQPCKLQ